MLIEAMWYYFGKTMLATAGSIGGLAGMGYGVKSIYDDLNPQEINMVRDLSRHMFIYGDTGSGKTYRAIIEAIKTISDERRFPIIWFDITGNTTDALLSQIPEWRCDDVVIIRPSDYEYLAGINVYSDPLRETDAEDIVKAYQCLFRGNAWGDNIEAGIKQSAKAVLEYGMKTKTKLDILDPFRFCFNEKYHLEVRRYVHNIVTENFWNTYDYGKKGKPSKDFRKLMFKLSNPLESRHLLATLGHPKPLDIADLIKENKIIIFQLGEDLGDEASSFLASIVFTKVTRGVLAKRIRPRFLQIFCDEIQEYLGTMGKGLEKNLARIRQFRVGLVLICQSLFQLEDFGNMAKAIQLCNTKYLHKPVNKQDAEIVLKLFDLEKKFPVSRLARMETARCLAVELVGGRIQRPKVIKNPHIDYDPYYPTPEQQDKIEILRELSRAKYCMPRKVVEDAIRRKLRDELDINLDDDFIEVEAEVEEEGGVNNGSNDGTGLSTPKILGEVKVL